MARVWCGSRDVATVDRVRPRSRVAILYQCTPASSRRVVEACNTLTRVMTSGDEPVYLHVLTPRSVKQAGCSRLSMGLSTCILQRLQSCRSLCEQIRKVLSHPSVTLLPSAHSPKDLIREVYRGLYRCTNVLENHLPTGCGRRGRLRDRTLA